MKKIMFRKPAHLKSKIAKVGIAIVGLVGGLAGTFFLVPNKTSVVDLGMPEEAPAKEETYFSRLVSKFTKASELKEDEELYPAISADFNNFEVSWPNNKIEIGGNLKLSMKNLNDISLSLDLDLDYNDKKCDVALALANKTVYFALKDLRLKQSFVENDVDGVKDIGDIVDQVYSQFFDSTNEDGLRINFSITDLLGSLVGGADLGSLLGGAGIGLDVVEEETEDDVNVNLNVSMAGDEGEEPTNLSILIVLGKENLDLKKVDLGTIKLGDIEIKGSLDCVTSDEIKIVGLDDPTYPKQRGEFIEVINYSKWIDRVFNLLNTRQIGLDLNANLKIHDGSEVKNLGYLDLAADLDASELFDLHDFDLLGVISGEKSIDSILGIDGPEDTENAITGILNKFDFNVGVKLGNIIDNVKKEYSNLNLAYYTNDEGHNAGYLAFNETNDEAVMRAKIDVQTINYVIAKIPELIDSIQGEEITKVSKSENAKTGFFDFITSSDLVSAIKDGHYEGVLDVIETLKSTEKTIEIVLNLSSLGFGDNAKVKIVLDASDDDILPTKVVSVVAEKIRLNDLELDAEIYTRPFSKTGLEKVNAIADKYDSLDFVPGVFDQVQNIIDTKQAAISLDGSIFDENNLGFDFTGWTQLDYGAKNGMGSIKFNEYKDKAGVVANDHQVDISIDDFDSDHAKNNMKFEYSNPTQAAELGDTTPLRGKFTLKTFDDIIDLVMDLVKQQDRRFMKFLDDILAELRNSLIVQIISSQDYLQLAQSSYITSIKQSADEKSLDIFISEKLIPMDLIKSPIHIQIEFGLDSNNQRNLKAVHIVDLDLGEKKVNANIQLVEYVEGRENPVNTEAAFLDFSDIAVLLNFGINTMELDYYHLTGTANVSALLVFNFSLNVDFHITVHDEKTKIYGRINNIPVIGDVLNVCNVYTEFLFEPDHDASNNDIGGYFYILRHEDRIGSLRDKQYLYKSDSKNFLDKILTYLVSSCFGISADLVDSLGDLDLGNGEQVNPMYENMFTSTGFQYTHTETQDIWNVGVDLGVVTGNDSFSALEATITGTEVEGKGYFTGIKASTKLAKVVNAEIDLKLENPDPTIGEWPDSIENRYNRIISYYKDLYSNGSDPNFNNPSKAYSCSYGVI